MAVSEWEVSFNCTAAEQALLLQVFGKNCDCKYGFGVRVFTCTVHEAMLHDQRWLSGLIWARRYWEQKLPYAGKRIIPLKS